MSPIDFTFDRLYLFIVDLEACYDPHTLGSVTTTERKVPDVPKSIRKIRTVTNLQFFDSAWFVVTGDISLKCCLH